MNNATIITLCSFNLKYASSDRFLSDTLEQTFFLVPLKLTEVYCILLHPSPKLFQSMTKSREDLLVQAFRCLQSPRHSLFHCFSHFLYYLFYESVLVQLKLCMYCYSRLIKILCIVIMVL